MGVELTERIYFKLAHEFRDKYEDLSYTLPEEFKLSLLRRLQEMIVDKNYLLIKIIFSKDFEISPSSILNFFFFLNLVSNRSINLFKNNPDRFGQEMIWPYTANGFYEINRVLSVEQINQLEKFLHLEEIAFEINNTTMEEVKKQFPKSYRKLRT